jgi:hypothetical protein
VFPVQAVRTNLITTDAGPKTSIWEIKLLNTERTCLFFIVIDELILLGPRHGVGSMWMRKWGCEEKAERDKARRSGDWNAAACAKDEKGQAASEFELEGDGIVLV